MQKLHWSIDYTYQRTKLDFREELTQTLAAALSSPAIGPDAKRKVHRYTMLPNFWAGFKEENPDDPSLTIGYAAIERTHRDGEGWQYHVEQVNAISGEELVLDFACEDELLRPLRDTWQIRARNSADGSYSSISWTGTCDRDADGVRNVQLTTEGGLSVRAGSVAAGATLTCNWTLFDVLPALRDGDVGALAILEDLETLKDACQVRHFDDWTLQLGQQQRALAGYCIFGVGLPPSYWWLTETGDVAAVSTMIATYVLTEREA